MLLCYCAARANYTFAAHYDASLRRCLSQLVNVDPSTVYWDLASLPLSLGGLGLRSASLTSRPPFWSSWADCLGMVQQRHPDVSTLIVHALDGSAPWFSFRWRSALWGTSGSSWFSNTDLGGSQLASGQSSLRGTWTGNQVCRGFWAVEGALWRALQLACVAKPWS